MPKNWNKILGENRVCNNEKCNNGENNSKKILEKYQKDLQRENDICNLLSCDFVIIYDRTH